MNRNEEKPLEVEVLPPKVCICRYCNSSITEEKLAEIEEKRMIFQSKIKRVNPLTLHIADALTRIVTKKK